MNYTQNTLLTHKLINMKANISAKGTNLYRLLRNTWEHQTLYPNMRFIDFVYRVAFKNLPEGIKMPNTRNTFTRHI